MIQIYEDRDRVKGVACIQTVADMRTVTVRQHFKQFLPCLTQTERQGTEGLVAGGKQADHRFLGSSGKVVSGLELALSPYYLLSVSGQSLSSC